MLERRLIVNADDLGLSPSVNTAILEVHRAGNLSSATLMVNMPGTIDAVERTRGLAGLGIGLHFCITEGMALTGASRLTDTQGRFLDRPTLVRAAVRGRVRADDLRRELEAQLARAADLGVRLTHMDSHQHVHMVPAIFRAIAPVIERHGLPVRMVDPPSGAVLRAWRRPAKALKQWLNGRFAAQDRALFNGRTNDALVSIHDLDHPGPYTPATYMGLLAAIPEDRVVEVMVHPYILGSDVTGLYAQDLERKRPFLERCVAEHAALTVGPVFGGCRLIDFTAA